MVFPEANCCHFPFGTSGVSLLGPCCETETKGASPSDTLPHQPCLGATYQSSLDQLLGKYQYQPATNPRGPPEEEGKEELMAPA